MSLGDGAGGVPAGWYPDPADDSRLRRWDGTKWTPDVILAPEDAQAAPQPSAPAASPVSGFAAPNANRTPAPPQYAEPPAPPAGPFSGSSFSAPPPGAASGPGFTPQADPPPPTQTGSDAPPPPPPSGPPSATSPLASSPPPDPYAPKVPPVPPQTFSPGAAPSPTAAPTAPPTAPPPATSVASPPSPTSGPVSLPEWATLPGLTLPPDLSGIPGLEPDPVLKAPQFEDVQRLQLRPDWNAPPAEAEQANAAPPEPYTHPTAAKDYAPPPAGAQYDVPPPPGATRAPAAGPVLPPSSLPDTRPRAGQAPTVQAALPAAPTVGAPPRIPSGGPATPKRTGKLTLWAWLIALLPLIQFGVIYLVFVQLGSPFVPGMQWGILAAPAAFALLFAIVDQRSLTSAGVDRAPSPLLAIVPPIYLLARAIDAGRSSATLLIAWFVLQAAAAAGVYYLLPTLLALALKAIA